MARGRQHTAKVRPLTPARAFMIFSGYILDPTETGHASVEEMTDLAIRHISGPVRRAAADFIQSHNGGTRRELVDMWIGSNARIGPDLKSARGYTEKVLKRLRDPSIPDGRPIPMTDPG